MDAARPPKIIAMVPKFDHARLHLLYQIRVGWLHAEIVAIGRDTESRVLARAVKLHVERRVLLCGSRTVVFGKQIFIMKYSSN